MDIIETLVFLNLDLFWLIWWVFCLFGAVILRGLWKCRGGLCKSLLEIFTHHEQERFITHYSAQVGCLQLKETNPATFNITLQHVCTSVYQLCVCVCLSNVLVFIVSHHYVFEWVAMCGWYLYAVIHIQYSIVSFQLCVCVCVCYFVLWVLRVRVFPLLETQFELNSLLSWASGGIFYFFYWQHYTATVI